MSKASLVLSIVGGGLFLIAFMPFLWFLWWPAILCCFVGLILGIVGIVKKSETSNAIAGTIISAVFLALSIWMTVGAIALLSSLTF